MTRPVSLLPLHCKPSAESLIERNELQSYLAICDPDSVRRIQQEMSALPLLFASDASQQHATEAATTVNETAFGDLHSSLKGLNSTVRIFTWTSYEKKEIIPTTPTPIIGIQPTRCGRRATGRAGHPIYDASKSSPEQGPHPRLCCDDSSCFDGKTGEETVPRCAPETPRPGSDFAPRVQFRASAFGTSLWNKLLYAVLSLLFPAARELARDRTGQKRRADQGNTDTKKKGRTRPRPEHKAPIPQ